MLKVILSLFLFCIVLFLYLHIQFHLKTSDDLEIFKMGYQLLMNHDYSKEKDLFFLCIAKASSRNWYSRTKGIATEKIIKEIKKDYKNIKF
jgi:hypothetical protein